MIFRQITHDDLGCASYLVGDEDAGVAAVVDPRLDIDEYLRARALPGRRASSTSSRPTTTPTTSPGHGRLAAATGATIHIHRSATPDYDHEPFDDGWELELGALAVRALHTPGHRPEHTAFALIDTARGARAVGGADRRHAVRRRHRAARPRGRQGARARAASSTRCTTGCSTLPDTCEVWPGHLGGSLCGGPGMDLKVSSTIGFERAPQRAARRRRRGRVRRARDRRARPAAAELPGHRRAQPRPADADGVDARSAHAAPGRAAPAPTARWSSTSAPSCSSTRRTSPARSASPRCAPASAPSWPGSPTATSRVVLVGRDDDDARARDRAGRRRSASPTSPATSPAA